MGVGLVGEYINCGGKRRRGEACGRDNTPWFCVAWLGGKKGLTGRFDPALFIIIKGGSGKDWAWVVVLG